MFCFVIQPQAYAKSEPSDEISPKFHVITKDENKVEVEARYSNGNSDMFRSFGKTEQNDSDIVGVMTVDKKEAEMTLVTNEKSEDGSSNETVYEVLIHSINDDGEMNATFTNLETNESFLIEQDKLQASFVIPIGVIIGEALLGYLLGIGAALVVAYETISVINEVRDILKKDQRYHHYTARILGGNLYVGNAIDLSAAAARIMNPIFTENTKNVWSTNSALAEAVARVAGEGKTPKGPEVTCGQLPGNFYYAHYHTNDRTGGHSFF